MQTQTQIETPQIVLLKQTNGALSKLIESLTKQVTGLSAAASEQERIGLETELKRTELANLSIQFEEAKRQAEVEFSFNLREHKMSTISAVLHEQGKTVIDATELQKMQQELSKYKTDFASQLAADVAKATSILKAQHALELKEQAFGSLFANPRDLDQTAHFLAGNSLRQITDGQAGEDG